MRLMTHRIAVIIVNWNVRDHLHACLSALFERTALARDEMQVIVVDNASHDGSVKMVRGEFPTVRLIESDVNLGFAGGCQLGYSETSAPVVMLLNPDTIVHPGAVDQMLATIEGDAEIGILGSRLVHTDGSFQRAGGGAFPTLKNLAWNYAFLDRLLPDSWAPEPIYISGDPPGKRPIDWVSGASLTFRREAVGEQIFSPDIFMFGEDMEVCKRVADAGWKVIYSAEQTITHHQGQSFAQQTDAEILSSIYKGPRTFFRRQNGPVAGAIYDAILFFGYGVRWLGFSVTALFSGKPRHRDMARFSARYLSILLGTWSRETFPTWRR